MNNVHMKSKRPKRDMVRKIHYLAVKEVEKIESTSENMGISSSELLRRIIDSYFENKENENNKIV